MRDAHTDTDGCVHLLHKRLHFHGILSSCDWLWVQCLRGSQDKTSVITVASVSLSLCWQASVVMCPSICSFISTVCIALPSLPSPLSPFSPFSFPPLPSLPSPSLPSPLSPLLPSPPLPSPHYIQPYLLFKPPLQCIQKIEQFTCLVQSTPVPLCSGSSTALSFLTKGGIV